MASLCRTGEGFALTLTARRDQLKTGKRRQVTEAVKMRRKLKRLKNRELELERKVSELSKWLRRYKSTRRSKVRVIICSMSNFSALYQYINKLTGRENKEFLQTVDITVTLTDIPTLQVQGNEVGKLYSITEQN